MLSDDDFALELTKVGRLDFVDQVIGSINEPLVLVELSPSLVELLPYSRSRFYVERSKFTVDHVINQYELLVVNKLVETLGVATELLRSTKAQTRRG